MSKIVNVIYTRPIPNFGPLAPEFVQMIQAVDPRIKFRDVAELVNSEKKGDSSATKTLNAILAETEVMFGFPPIPNLLSRAPNLKWVQSPLAGIEHFLTPDFIASGVFLTNARGIQVQVSEHALMMTLMLAKKTLQFESQRKEKRWQKDDPGLLYGKTMGVLGLGHIGSEIARLAKAFNMKVIGLEIRKRKRSDIVDAFLPPDRLPELLAKSDFIVSALPLTRDTVGMIGEAQLKMMKPTAYVINISRGGIVDEKALIRALKENWIAGAALDAFVNEPLASNSPLWDLPHLILTPHVAGLRVDYDLQITRLFCKNLRRYLKGQELLNIVDKEKGF